jgi:hypothetical protein
MQNSDCVPPGTPSHRQVRKFGAEIAPSQSGPKPCRLTTKLRGAEI